MKTQKLEILQPPNKESIHFKAREMGEIIRIRSTVLNASKEYLIKHGFVEVQTPILTSLTGACENLSSLFEIKYFGNRAFLRQTSQLHLETFIYGKDTPCVFTVGTSFRKEPRSDGRHLTEFTLIEVEGANYNLEKLIRLITELLNYVIKSVLLKNKNDLKNLRVNMNKTKNFLNFKKITYTKAIDFLRKAGLNIIFGKDLNAEAEKRLTKHFGPLLVTHYPKKIKFFNMKENLKNPMLVNCVDVLLPNVGEVVGGSEREESWKKLYENLHTPEMQAQFERVGGNCLDFKWYLDIRKPKPVQHGGFGLGVERLIQFILNSPDIKSSIMYPRDSKHIYP